jgi:hypothetical protein
MRDNTTLFFITFFVLLVIGLFNTYMNLYNDHNIKCVDERIDLIENKQAQIVDTIIIKQNTHIDSTYIISFK